MLPIALKRTEFKRTTTQRNKKRNSRRKERYDAKKLTQLTKRLAYQSACEEVDNRDGHCLECKETYGLEHHHAKLRSAGGKDDKENLVLLCGWCHRDDPKAPHQCKEGKDKWVKYLTKLYPAYWRESRKSQMIIIPYNNRTSTQQEVAK